MKIMVFLHGTVLMHRTALGQTREERVRQVIAGDESVQDFASYVPAGDAVRKLQRWQSQNAELVYLSSQQDLADLEKDRTVLRRYGFPDGPVLHRQNEERYADIAARIRPDVFIEDDCESIGGEEEMTYPHIAPELKAIVKSIVVKEFGGIDHLPDNVHDLLSAPASE